MTPEAQRTAIRTAIAQACDLHTSSCPDYLSDLNAMREAENLLRTYRDKMTYVNWLVDLCEAGAVVVMAPAAKRAEAFLRTIEKWTDDL